MSGTLFVVTTPIGNLEDLTFRAVRTLGELDVLACEDTRQTRKIFTRYEITSPRQIFSYHEHNAQQAGKQILEYLQQGLSVGLCSDAGSPGISDPGYKIISDSIEHGFALEIIPGPSAVTTALVLSGLSTASYTFKGFSPPKSGQRKKFIARDGDAPHTLVFFESPYRINKFLQDAHEVLGDRKAAVCVELTKKFERVHRGFLGELVEQFQSGKIKGEITVVIAGNHPKFIRPSSSVL
ncbi:MAG: 16S rRNA (cytidine(1402)-2'-O)-methyltransferase [SAR324 cluster bacterium]|nr:16S rRNA (cytidine(1402)-2'-O)-methyltransferase [SAR324 cluster bacterium]